MAALDLPARSPKRPKYWIRVPVQLGPVSDPGLLLGPIAFLYEVYWDGRQIGTFGKFPPYHMALTPVWAIYHVPVDLATPGLHTVAIRVLASGVGVLRVPRIRSAENCVGNFGLLNAIEVGLWTADFHARLLELLMVSAYFLIGFFCLLLPRSIAPGSAFRWFGLSNVAAALAKVLSFVLIYNARPIYHIATQLSGSLAVTAAIEFAYAMYRRRVPTAVRVLQLLVLSVPFWGFLPLPLTVQNNLALAIVASWIVSSVLPIPLLWREFRKASPGAGMMTLLFGFLACAFFAEWLLIPFGLLPPLHLAGYELVYPTMARLLFVPLVALQIGKLNRRTREEQQRLRGEMEAARRVQEILLPAHDIQMPGFHIDAAYYPATEVGGDFFQLFPAADGSLLMVVGDVSGKGLQAALLVSMIVGALRSRKSDRPSLVLNDLNSALVGQAGAGFTTCCCGLFSPDGALTIANAGHLAPYVNGREIQTAPGLPLGVTREANWEETHINLEPSDRIVWISDGVVEARNGTRDLLGFDRAQQLAARSASEIARAAQQFGQEDDITVVSITRQPIPMFVA